MATAKLVKQKKPLSASAEIDQKIDALEDWRGDALCTTRALIHAEALSDSGQLCNESLDGNARRALDIRAGEKVNARAFKALVRAAVKLNSSRQK